MERESFPYPAFDKTPAGAKEEIVRKTLKIKALYRGRESWDYRWALAAAGACGSLSIQPIFSLFSSGPINVLLVS